MINTIWSDTNRFKQKGVYDPTVFPIRKNYKNENKYNIDLSRAIEREEYHKDFIDSLDREYLDDLMSLEYEEY
jgi:hypothetical protein